MYREGYAVEKNMIKASEYCEKSCKLGLEVACEELKKLPQTPIIKKLKGKNLNQLGFDFVFSSTIFQWGS